MGDTTLGASEITSKTLAGAMVVTDGRGTFPRYLRMGSDCWVLVVGLGYVLFGESQTGLLVMLS